MSNCNSCPSKGTCGKQADSCGIQNNERNKIRHVIGVMSGKGGVGKSSMSVLMAKEMARRGFRVGIMDADITGPSIPRLMGLEHAQAFGTNDAIEPVVDKDGIKELDYLFIDMPPGTGDVALTVLQSLPVSGVIMVSTPQPMVSMIVSKAINMCKQVKVEVLGIIENMSYVVCPDCGKRIEIFQHRNVEDFVRENEVPLWAELPMMDSISRIYKDDDFDTETAQQMYAWISPAADQLIEKMGK